MHVIFGISVIYGVLVFIQWLDEEIKTARFEKRTSAQQHWR